MLEFFPNKGTFFICLFYWIIDIFECDITKHSDKSSLQLDKASANLAVLKQPIVIAKVDADKYSRLASKYEIEYVCFTHISYYYNYFV